MGIELPPGAKNWCNGRKNEALDASTAPLCYYLDRVQHRGNRAAQQVQLSSDEWPES